MEYTIGKLATLAGISTRTLRFYETCGLLEPLRIGSNGYRIYGGDQIDRLQQLLLFRELGLELSEIKKLLDDPHFSRQETLVSHLSALKQRRQKLDALIHNVEKSILETKGEITMSEEEKFVGFKQKLLQENEANYGDEVRALYGREQYELSNSKVKNLSQEQYDEAGRLSGELEEMLKEALVSGDPSGEAAQQACDLHRIWLCLFYPNYSQEYHLALGEMYTTDERFRAYYEKIYPGCASFFHEAIRIYCATLHRVTEEV